jgi:hypothetical protein
MLYLESYRRQRHELIGLITVVFCWACAALVAAGSPGIASVADLLLINGNVYTVAKKLPKGEAVAVRDGKILFVGTNREAAAFRNAKTTVIDLGGNMVLPGFQDSHIHLIESGVDLGRCQFNDLESRREILDTIQEYAEANPDKTWIVGGGWELTSFPAGKPTREDLDSILPDRPAFFSSTDGHSGWVNSQALKLAGITSQTPDPKDGRIERRPGSREPSGTLRESAMEPVMKLLPETTTEELTVGLKRAQKLALRAGITSIIDARTETSYLKAYADADRRGNLHLRVWASLSVDTDRGPEQVKEFVDLRNRYRTPRLQASFAKIFADGVIEAHTAALLEPYHDTPGDSGKLILKSSDFNALAAALEQAGFQIHVHAIGDGAVRQTLDAFEFARKTNGGSDRRHQIAHLELVHPTDIPRFSQLGVVADFQPLWATADSYIKDLTAPLVGPERAQRLYPIGSVKRSGAVVAAGSDWSVSSLNPLEAMQVAVTRQDPQNPAGKPWLPAELIDLASVIEAYTINGAYLTHQEKHRGSIEVGKIADLVVLDQDLFKIPVHNIAKTKVVMTLIDGKIVYSSEDRDAEAEDDVDDDEDGE